MNDIYICIWVILQYFGSNDVNTFTHAYCMYILGYVKSKYYILTCSKDRRIHFTSV